MITSNKPFFAILHPLSSILALVLLTACSHPNTATLILHPLDSKKTFSQKFTQTYSAHNDDGSYEFLLVADEVDNAKRAKSANKPLRPSAEIPLRQLVHIRVPWIPMRGNVAETVVSNASINWYITSDVSTGANDLILYSGAGYALADSNDKNTTLTLRSSTLKPTKVQGSLTDPLGPFHLTGSLTTNNNPAQLNEILTTTKSRLGL
jgi:hypothetical protein